MSKSGIHLKITKPAIGFVLVRAECGIRVKGSVSAGSQASIPSSAMDVAGNRTPAYRLELHIGNRCIDCPLEPNLADEQRLTFNLRFFSKPGFKWMRFILLAEDGAPIATAKRLILVPRNRDIARVEIPRSGDSLPFGVNLVSLFRYELGIAEAGRLTASALRASAVPHALVEAPFQPNCPDENIDFRGAYTQALPYRINLFHFNAPEMTHIRAHWPAVLKNGQYNIGHWAWELPRLPKAWIKGACGLNEIWTCSEFVRASVASGLNLPVHVVRYPIRLHPPDSRGLPSFPEHLTKVLFAFDFNSYTARKNPEAALRAFEIAVAQEPSMHLILKVHNAGRHPEAARRLAERVRSLPSVTLISDTLTRGQMTALQASADVFLSLHRSEGFGLNIAECMALGKPVIVTGWSGNMDFTNEDNAYLVPFELITIQRQAGDYEVGQKWADPDVEAAAGHLLHVVRHPEAARLKGERAQAYIEEHYSIETTTRHIRERLDQIRIEQGF